MRKIEVVTTKLLNFLIFPLKLIEILIKIKLIKLINKIKIKIIDLQDKSNKIF